MNLINEITKYDNIISLNFLNYNTPLIYDDTLNTTNITNVLLIDSNVQDYNSFITYCNSDTFPIVYSYTSNRDDLIKLLKVKFTSIKRIGIVTHDAGINNGKLFLNNQLLFTNDDLTNDCIEYSDNLDFIINVIKKFDVTNFDYLACNTLKYSNWNNYYNILSSKTDVIVGASNDETGNIKYGGDWIIESTNQDIEYIYFTSGIENYANVLATTITGTVIITQTLVNSYTFPVTISGGSTVKLGENITLTGSISNYFIIGGDGITFNGAGFTVTISNTPNYLGLIQNGTVSIRGFSCNIQNVGILSSGTTTLNNAGWLCQSYFGTASGTIIVADCFSTGVIYEQCGGIFGFSANYLSTSGTITVNGCYSTGNINGNQSGGIFNYNANNSSSGTINVIDCYYTGNISGGNSGGIFGSYTNVNSSGRITVNNCYSTGTISNFFAGGIFGASANFSCSSTITITNCYSSGTISSSFTGGIFGYSANNSSSGTITVTDCYSTGTISGYSSGGIFGGGAIIYSSSAKIIVTGCYSIGAITGGQSGGIFGEGAINQSTLGTITVTDCYSTGTISGNNCGGIFANLTIYNSTSGIITVTNCYSIGNISGNSCGGIFSRNSNYNSTSGIINVISCYSAGIISGNNSGGIFGPDQYDTINQSNTYAANGSWSNTIASSNGINIGSIWSNLSNLTTIPYTLTTGFSTPSYNTQYYSTNSFLITLSSNYIYFILVQPQYGTVTISGNTLTYSQTTSNQDTFTYQANNGINYYSLSTVNIYLITVTLVSPVSGSIGGNQSVTITGTNFIGVTSVTFAGIAATNVVVVSSTSITCTTPSGKVGTASVLVITPNGTNSSNTLYTYEESIQNIGISCDYNTIVKDLFCTKKKNKLFLIKLQPFNINYSYIIIEKPKYGKLLKNKKGDYLYKPDKNYKGKDLFTYQYYIKNTCVISNIKTFNLNYLYKIIQQPEYGKLLKNKKGDLLYKPNKNYTGTDLFIYRYYIKNTSVISKIRTFYIKKK